MIRLELHSREVTELEKLRTVACNRLSTRLISKDRYGEDSYGSHYANDRQN